MKTKAFTLLELVFVIVIMGILSTVGVEILLQIYTNYIGAKTYNELEVQTDLTINQISNRLEYRIKDSVIARAEDNDTFNGLQSASGNEKILEWIGVDREGFLGELSGDWNKPTWSGFIDVNHPDATSTRIVSPESNTSAIDEMIKALSENNSTIDDSVAIYFVGYTSDVKNGYGWDSIDHNHTSMHEISVDINESYFDGNFSGVDVYEFYQLSWSAYALKLEADGNLTLYYNYQPWKGEKYVDGNSSILMENVQTFMFQGVGDMIKIQICVNSNFADNNYSLCKEKAVF